MCVTQTIGTKVSLSLTSLDFLGTDIDKNCLRFCAVWDLLRKLLVIGGCATRLWFGVRLRIPLLAVDLPLYGRVVGWGGVWCVKPICLNTLQRSRKRRNSFPTLGNGLWSILSFRRNCVSWSSLDVNKYSSTISAISWLSACNAL